MIESCLPEQGGGRARSSGRVAGAGASAGDRGRQRCPTCEARRRAAAPSCADRSTCHRCGSDLSLLLAIEAQADRLRAQALAAYGAGRFRVAAARAAEAVRLEARPDVLCLLAAAALRAGDFTGAARAARRVLAGKLREPSPG